MKVVTMNFKEGQRLRKVTSIISVVNTLEKYMLFSCLDFLVFSVYLNTNKKKQFFQIQILSTVKNFHFGIHENKSTRKINLRKI